MAFTPISMAPSTTSNSECSPCSWPAVRGSPRLLGPAAVAVHDHRDVPGHLVERDRRAAVAPEGCGVGRRTGCRPLAGPAHRSPLADVGQRAQTALQVPGDERRHQPARLATVALLGGVDDRPVAGEQGAEQQQRLGRRARRPRHPAGRAQRPAGGRAERAVRPLEPAVGAGGERRARSRPPTASAAGTSRARRRSGAPPRSSRAARRRAGGTAAPTAAAPRRPAARRSRASRSPRCSGRSRRRWCCRRARGSRPG